MGAEEVKLCADCAHVTTKVCNSCNNKDCWSPANIITQKDELQVIADGKQPHYTRFKIQPREFCYVNGLGGVEYNVIKYICRYPYKEDPMKDLIKARESIDYLIAKQKEQSA